MNAVGDIILLGEKLREARDLVLRSDTLENSCRETEARLESLRVVQAQLRAENAAAEAQARETLETAERQATGLLNQARELAKRLAAESDAQCAGARAAAEAEAAAATAEVARLREAKRALVEECDGLNVARHDLKAEIESLRSKARALLE